MAEKTSRPVWADQTSVALRRRLRKLAGQVESLARSDVAIREQAAYRSVIGFRDALGLRIDDAVARVDELDVSQHQLARRADHDQAFHLAFEARRRLSNARMLHGDRRRWRKPGLLEL